MLINLGTVLISERMLLILLVTKSTTSTSETDVLLLIFLYINYMEIIHSHTVLLCHFVSQVKLLKGVCIVY